MARADSTRAARRDADDAVLQESLGGSRLTHLEWQNMCAVSFFVAYDEVYSIIYIYIIYNIYIYTYI